MNYIGSEYHKDNIRKARIRGLQQIKENKKLRIDEYDLNPNVCKQCNNSLSYSDKHKKFCNNSCAAKYNNTRRKPRTEASRKKTSKKLTGKKVSDETKLKIKNNWNGGLKYCKIKVTECNTCKNIFVQRNSGIKKTCSEKCRYIAMRLRSYHNGNKKLFLFNNPYQGQVVLESSWELEIAELLTEKKIKWIRPEPMKWVDNENKEHLYYPDFYLPEKDLYLDPKNPYCMELDTEKMEIVSKEINIIYGNIEKIKNVFNW